MSLTYNSYIAQMRSLAAVDATDPWFNQIVNGMIDYAEQRIYRDLNLLQTVVTDSTLALTSGNRALTLSNTASYWVTVQQVNVVTPAGSTVANGTRRPLLPTSRAYLNYAWPAATGAGRPTHFAMQDQFTIIVGPWPDAAYAVEVVGTKRPAPISPTNQTTILSMYFPDLLVAASMIYVTGFQRDFGAQADDPKSAQSWEQQYQNLIASAATEEARKKLNAA